MEFHQLRYFVAAARDLSFSKAAERLHVSQPSISKQVALLEEELGAPLFLREKKRVRLSPAGAFFLEKAQQLLCDAETVTLELRERYGESRRTLRLGFLSTFLDDLVVPVLREFQQRHARAQVALFELPPQAQLQRLRDGELDAAILANFGEEDRRRFRVTKLSHHRMAVILPAGHRLATSAGIKLAELAGEAWISLAESAFPGRRAFLLETCRKAGFTPRVVAEPESIPLLMAAVATGTGVGLLPAHTAKLPHAGCRFVPLRSPRLGSTLCLLTPKQDTSRELEALAALIAEQGRQLDESTQET